ncbi:MAG: transposase [Limnochordaceae bacterium]|nr:transposase [Limnochordaceae bacterium]
MVDGSHMDKRFRPEHPLAPAFAGRVAAGGPSGPVHLGRRRPPRPRDELRAAQEAGGVAEPAKPDEREQYNFTDLESRVMLGGNSPKGFLQAYNVQAVVDTDSGIVVAVEATDQAADSPHLPAMVGAIERNVSRLPKELLADAGYYSEANLDVLEQAGISALIPQDKVTHSRWRRPGPSPKGRIPKGMSRRDRMRRRLETKAGRAIYKLRQETIEPVFGQVKEQQGFRRFLLRGRRGARAETFLVFLTYNLRKLLFTFRGRVGKHGWRERRPEGGSGGRFGANRHRQAVNSFEHEVRLHGPRSQSVDPSPPHSFGSITLSAS